MSYKDVNDEELVYLINESNEDAKNVLYEKYSYIIDIYVKKYLKAAYKLGVELNDLKQEALLGLSEAINSYDTNVKASLPTFISICVERKIQNAIVKAGRLKNKILNEALSLDYLYLDKDVTLAEVLSDHDVNNPLNKLTSKEQVEILSNKINSILSDNEKDVYNLLINGLSYVQIAEVLNISLKSADNAIQRIKNKVRKELNKL